MHFETISLLVFLRFSEMPTNNYVESSFWNFDALFQPQQHPARDAHDTFFVFGKYILLTFLAFTGLALYLLPSTVKIQTLKMF